MQRSGKPTKLTDIGTEAMRQAALKAIEDNKGCIKAAAIDLGYRHVESFYGTLKRLGLEVVRTVRLKDTK